MCRRFDHHYFFMLLQDKIAAVPLLLTPMLLPPVLEEWVSSVPDLLNCVGSKSDDCRRFVSR